MTERTRGELCGRFVGCGGALPHSSSSALSLEKVSQPLLHRRLLARYLRPRRPRRRCKREGRREATKSPLGLRLAVLLLLLRELRLARQRRRRREGLSRVCARRIGTHPSGATSASPSTSAARVLSGVKELKVEWGGRERNEGYESLDMRRGGDREGRKGKGGGREDRDVVVEETSRVDDGHLHALYRGRRLAGAPRTGEVEREGEVELAEVGGGERTAEVAHGRLD